MAQQHITHIKDYVQDYVLARNLKTILENSRPRKNWLCEFMKRNKISLKKANLISAAHKSKTSNPFWINGFYDLIKEYVVDPELFPAQVCNTDESSFPTDPAKAKVIAPKEKVTNKLICRTGRENITTPTLSSAAGRVLNPLIIFSLNFQSNWRGKQLLKNLCYGISKKGG